MSQHRLTNIITRTGDDGTTGLGDGTRISKTAPRIEALGDVDELNSALGVLLCEEIPEDIRQALFCIQNDLFDLGGELSLPGATIIGASHVARLEELAVRCNASLPPLQEFVLPGGSRAAALAHLCRAICRRAERTLGSLEETGSVSNFRCRYLNRLSDVLFILARTLNQSAGKCERYWKKREPHKFQPTS